MVVLGERLDLRALPKAELHLHLEATLSAGTARELADRYALPAPPPGPFGGQAAFVRAYEAARDLVRTLDDLRRVAAELAERQAADGVVWSEVHLAPSTYAGRLGPTDGLVEAFLDGAGDRVGLVLGINRGLPVEEAERTVDLALRWAGRGRGGGVVALGIAGDEAAYPLAPFAPAFARARAAGLVAVPHCGEGTDAAAVRAALPLEPDRICHGLGAAGDAALLAELARRGTCLDMAPSSNVALGLVPSLAEHPLPSLLRRGVEVTVSTDIPGFLGHGLVEELERCRRAWGLTDRELESLADASLRRASVPVRGRG